MKSTYRISIQVIVAVFILTALSLNQSCQKREWENPYDEQVSPSSWAPYDLQIEDVSITEKKISWQYYGNPVEGFKIDRKVGEATWQNDYAVLANNTYEFIDTNIIPDPEISYQYRIFAYAGNNKSSILDTTSTFFIPSPQQLILQKLNDITIKLTWDDNSIGEQGFKIDRKTGENNWDIAFKTLPPNTTECIDSIFNRDFALEYRVYAFWGDVSSESISNNEIVSIPAPTDLTLDMPNLQQINLSWTDNSEGEQGFKIDRKVGSGSWEFKAQVGENAVEYTDTDFPLNETIYYRIYAFVDTATSSYTQAADVNSTIPAPTDLILDMPNLQQINLSWTDQSEGEQGFKIYRKVGSGSWEFKAQVGENAAVYTDSDFPLNESIYYRVYAFVDTAISSYSQVEEVNTAIPAPTNLTLDMPNLQQINLSWTDQSEGEQGFKIDRKVGSGSWETAYGEVNANVGSFMDNDDFSGGEIIYYRIYAFYEQFNSTYEENNINTFCQIGFTDPRNGEYYDVTLIGTQCWMAENLNIGTRIDGSDDMSDDGTIEKYCYDNDENNCDTYGGLYQWNEMMQYTTTVGTQGICPDGWHVPSDAEWKILEGTVDSQYGVGNSEWDDSGWRGYDAGKRLKSNNGWVQNTGTDAFGFSALPGGHRDANGSFYPLGTNGNGWSSAEYSSSDAWSRYMSYFIDDVYRYDYNKEYGFSVRCLKD